MGLLVKAILCRISKIAFKNSAQPNRIQLQRTTDADQISTKEKE